MDKGIETRISLLDDFSPQLEKMVSALDIVIGKMTNLQTQWGQTMSTLSKPLKLSVDSNLDLTGVKQNLAKAHLPVALTANKLDLTKVKEKLANTNLTVNVVAKAKFNSSELKSKLSSVNTKNATSTSSVGSKFNVALVATKIDLTKILKKLKATHFNVSLIANRIDLTKIREKLKSTYFKVNVDATRIDLSKIREKIANTHFKTKVGVDTSGLKSANVNINRVTDSFNKQRGVGASLASSVRNLAAMYLGMEAVGGVIKVSDNLTQIKSRIALINDGKQTQKELEDLIFRAAERSRSSYFDTAETVARIGMNAGQAFENTRELVGFSELLSKSFIIAGTKAEEMRSATLQLSQGMASNRLQGDELRTIFEAAPIITKYISKYLGVTQGEMREMAAEGKITAEVIKNALSLAADEINEKFAKMPRTFYQIWQSFKNHMLMAWSPLYDRLRMFANSDTFDAVFKSIVRTINSMAQVAIWAIDLIDNGLRLLRENLWWLLPILGSVSGAYIAMGIAAAFAKEGVIGKAVATAWDTVVTWGHQAATIASTIAQTGLSKATWGTVTANIGLAASINWVIGAVALFIGALYLVVAVFNKVAGTSISATGIIAGAIMFLFSVVWDVIAAIWNIVASVVEFIVNTWRTGVYMVATTWSWFFEFWLRVSEKILSAWDAVVTAIPNAFIWAINQCASMWNWLMDKLPMDIGKEYKIELNADGNAVEYFSLLDGAIGKLKSWGDSVSTWGDDMTPWEAPKMELKNPFGEYMKGYNWGKDLAAKFEGKLDILDELGYDEATIQELMKKYGFDSKSDLADYLQSTNPDYKQDLNDMDKDIYGNSTPYKDLLEKIEGNTKKTGDSFDEQIEWLRAIGSREATNRFTTAELKLVMNNDNKITSGVDLNTFIDKLTNEVRNAIMTSAEAVAR